MQESAGLVVKECISSEMTLYGDLMFGPGARTAAAFWVPLASTPTLTPIRGPQDDPSISQNKQNRDYQ